MNKILFSRTALAALLLTACSGTPSARIPDESVDSIDESGSLTRTQLAEYAASLSGLTKEELKTAASRLMQPQQVLAYGNGTSATWYGFWYTDRINTLTNECFNRYSEVRFYFTAHDGQRIDGMNIEHSFPKSWWGGASDVDAYKDLFNLYPSDAEANSAKSNYPMGEVTTVTSSSGEGYDVVGKGSIDGTETMLWEPGDLFKGEFARSYFYMATTYQDYTWQGTQGLQELETGTWPTLREWAYELYLEWVDLDRVDQLEVSRNNAVYAIQGNRNLFIDYPNLAQYIWGDSTDVAFDPVSSVSTASDDDRYLGAVVVSKPTFTPAAGTYFDAVDVLIRSTTPGTQIHYTLDGTTPTLESPLHTDTLYVSESLTIRAIAADDDGNLSSVATAEYLITEAEGELSGDTVYYFRETFDQCAGTGGNDSLFSGSVATSTFNPDNNGWEAAKAYGAAQCARFGTGSVVGTVSTPTFAVSGTSTLTFLAAPWGSDGTALTLSVSGDAVTLSQTTWTLQAGQWTPITVTLTGSGYVALTFTPTKRFFLDEVSVYSMVSDESDEGNTGEADGIHMTKADGAAGGTIHDLAGRRVTRPTRGIHIMGGKKVLF